MNAIGIALVWCALQVTVFSLVAAFLYAAARRWGPTARSHIALAGMVMVLALTGLAFSPWPRWTFGGRDEASPDRAEIVAPASASTGGDSHDVDAPRTMTVDGATAPVAAEQSSFGTVFWTTFLEELARPQSVPQRAEWRWPSLVAVLFLAGAALGTVRLLAGWAAVRALRRRSRPIHDPVLLGLLDVVQAELRCPRRVELRESDSLVTAATIGWRKPLILLPAEWQQWTEAERHAVLAHEIAHIGRHDFLAWIFAECGLVLHFYHPLVHWLAGRLRLEQELAADAAAAGVIGGPRPYLTTLAEMALRQPDRPLSWPARTFLPTRRTFLRRIEMLRDNRILTTRASAGVRFAALGLLCLAGFAVAGLRGPIASAQNEPPRKTSASVEQSREKSDESAGLDLRYIPRNAIGAAAARVADIYAEVKSPQLAQLIDESEFEKRFGIPLQAIEQVTVVFTQKNATAEPEPTGFIIFTQSAGQPKQMLDALAPERHEHEYAGKKFFWSKNEVRYFLPDDRTLIAVPVPPSRREEDRFRNTAAEVMSFIDASLGRGAADYDWMKAFQDVTDSHAALAMDLAWVSHAFERRPPRPPQSELAAMLQMVAPLWQNARTAALGVSLDDGVNLEGFARATSEDGAKRVQQTAQAVVTLLQNLMNQGREQIARAPIQERQLMQQIFGLGEALLKSAEITQEGRTVRLKAQAEGDGATSLIAAQVFPVVSAARGAARRTQSTNNLKRIALAMHNYQDVFTGFPPAVVFDPETKVPRSWRVELLPYLGEVRLYNEYRKDEPWDSEHNKKILEKMPAVFRNPKMPDGTTKTAYFVLTGPKALFNKEPTEREKGPKLSSVTDGTANTILVVEAEREVPWTKPEDIPYDAEKPLPEFGGFYEGGWKAAFADGHVSFISDNAFEPYIRALITPAGAEAVEQP